MQVTWEHVTMAVRMEEGDEKVTLRTWTMAEMLKWMIREELLLISNEETMLLKMRTLPGKCLLFLSYRNMPNWLEMDISFIDTLIM